MLKKYLTGPTLLEMSGYQRNIRQSPSGVQYLLLQYTKNGLKPEALENLASWV